MLFAGGLCTMHLAAAIFNAKSDKSGENGWL